MAKYPTTVATLPALTNQSVFNTTLVNTWVTEMMAFQRDYVSTIKSFSTLGSYYSIIRNDNGQVKVGVVSHGAVVSQLASQHHNKVHGSAHLTSDAIRPSQDGRAFYKGLMTKEQFAKVNNCVTTPNVGRQVAGSYTGLGTSGYRYISLGWAPQYIQLFMPYRSYNWRVYAIGASEIQVKEVINEMSLSYSSNILLGASGFSTSEDESSRDYYYLAIGSPS